jgi:hypothetical protein
LTNYLVDRVDEGTESWVVECTRRSEELVGQSYDVHVCVSGPGAQITAYHRLRFALQASSWFPRPLGIALWSALHVLLLVGGALLLPLLALMLDGFLHPSLEDIIIRLIWYLSCELVLRSLIFGSILRFVSHSNSLRRSRCRCWRIAVFWALLCPSGCFTCSSPIVFCAFGDLLDWVGC